MLRSPERTRQYGGASARDSVLRDGKEVKRLESWRGDVEMLFKKQTTFGDLGARLLRLVLSLDSPLGSFLRQHSNPMQPPPAAEAKYDRPGDLLPYTQALWCRGAMV